MPFEDAKFKPPFKSDGGSMGILKANTCKRWKGGSTYWLKNPNEQANSKIADHISEIVLIPG